LPFAEVIFSIPLDRSFTYDIPEGMDCTVGMRVTAFFGKRKMTGYVTEIHGRAPEGFEVKPLSRLIDKEPVFSVQQIDLATWMSSLYLCSTGEALALMIPGGRREVELPSYTTEDIPGNLELNLSAHQREALSQIITAEKDMYYLFGVTGSGKTEVFLKAAEHTLSQGRSVIYLVPEISLTHQLAQVVRSRFGDDVAILHSSLTPSQRLKQWLRIKKGEVNFIIGARSAVFAPCEDIGLIIIDEEHEHTYKSGSTPRYHARQIAFKRAAISGGTVVLGSATPSLETYQLMKEGRIMRLDLPERVSGGKMPPVEIIDMKSNPDILSLPLRREIRRVLDKKRQVILFLNRRGFSYFFHCKSCGYEMTCRHCSVPLTYHKEKNRMVCHYCGYSQKPIQVCPECGSLDMGYSGFGTELVEDAVKGYFPFASIDRLDADSTRKKEHLQQVLDRFEQGETDILLGTQMVAKGLNFPRLDLVGIVLADSGLHLPDFRAQERTFSLLLQVAGRTGRFSDTGKVMIQTFHPENRAVVLASQGDVEAFCEQELDVRKMLSFPPATRMVRFLFRSRSASKAEHEAERAADIAEKHIKRFAMDVDVLGPAEAPISRIAGNTRWQLMIRSSSFHQVHRIAAALNDTYTPISGVYMEIDIDPLSLM
jgi:primosomal protein N' (replication factor Y)